MEINYQYIVDNVHQSQGYDLTALALVEAAENQNVLKWRYVAGNHTNRLKKVVLRSGKGVAGQVFKTGKPIWMEQIDSEIIQDQMFNYPIIVFEQLESLGAVPLWHNGRVVGVLLGGFRKSQFMTQERMNMLICMSKHGFGITNGSELMIP